MAISIVGIQAWSGDPVGTISAPSEFSRQVALSLELEECVKEGAMESDHAGAPSPSGQAGAL
jgi:hypothetical protein